MACITGRCSSLVLEQREHSHHPIIPAVLCQTALTARPTASRNRHNTSSAQWASRACCRQIYSGNPGVRIKGKNSKASASSNPDTDLSSKANEQNYIKVIPRHNESGYNIKRSHGPRPHNNVQCLTFDDSINTHVAQVFSRAYVITRD